MESRVVDHILLGYLEALLFTSRDDDGMPFDSRYFVHDFDQKSIDFIRKRLGSMLSSKKYRHISWLDNFDAESLWRIGNLIAYQLKGCIGDDVFELDGKLHINFIR